MGVIDEIRNAIQDFMAKETRHPDRIYLGFNQVREVKKELTVNYFLMSDNQSLNDIKNCTFEGIPVYFVSENDHLHVC